MIIIAHIAKTGGMSFRSYLQQVFGSRLYQDYKGMREAILPRWRRVLGKMLRQPLGLPWGIACIMGHFPTTKYAEAFPGAQYGVWLRDPVERVVSHYRYYLRLPHGPNPVCRLVHERGLSLVDFAQLERIRNVQTQVLRGKPLTQFAFVGLTEHFFLGLQLFARVFGFPEPKAAPVVNKNHDRKSGRYELDPAERAQLLHLNLQDADAYQQAVDRFAHLCQTHGLEIPDQKTRLTLAS